MTGASPAPVPSIFDPVSTPAIAIRELSVLVLGLTGVIFVIVAGVALLDANGWEWINSLAERHEARATEAAEAGPDQDEATAALAGGKSLWTARVSKESQVRHGTPIELAVDTRYLQFFDPASGLSIGHPLAAAGLADQ